MTFFIKRAREARRWPPVCQKNFQITKQVRCLPAATSVFPHLYLSSSTRSSLEVHFSSGIPTAAWLVARHEMRILIVDDEKNIRRALDAGPGIDGARSRVQRHEQRPRARGTPKARPYDVVLLDLRLSQESGLEVLEEILRVAPQIAVVMVTAYASVETAVEAMRRGAFDYLPKPCTPEQVRQVLAPDREDQKSSSAGWRNWSRASARKGPEVDLTSQALRDAKGARGGVQGRRQRGHRLAARREWHWQERAGAGHASAQSPPRRARLSR